MSDDKEQLPFILSKNESFGSYDAADDYLHPVQNAQVSADSVSETQFFGCSIPGERLHTYLYCWHHPHLKVVSGGPACWRGIKPIPQSCELFDQRIFMSDRVLADDLNHYEFENGYRVRVVTPLREHRVTYADPTRGNALTLEYEALTPPIMHADGKHFEQPMRVRGDITLRGRAYRVDGYHVRDRSWGRPRPEDNFNMPPVGWHTGSFGDAFFFNCTATDHPALSPEWRAVYPEFKAEQSFKAGWIFCDGELSAIVSCEKQTRRDKRFGFPDRMRLRLVDDKARSWNIEGHVLAATSMATWWNLRGAVCLSEWTCDGFTGYGDTQEAQWHDFVHASRGVDASLKND